MHPNECGTVCKIRVSKCNICVSVMADVVLMYPIKLVDEEIKVAKHAVHHGIVGKCKVISVVVSVDCL